MTNIGTSVTIEIKKEDWIKPPTQPKLWTTVMFNGHIGIVYRIKSIIDEDGPGKTYSIKGWKIYKRNWQNKLALIWLKIKVKLHFI